MFRQFQQMLEGCCLILFIFYYHVLLLHLPHVSTIEAVVGIQLDAADPAPNSPVVLMKATTAV